MRVRTNNLVLPVQPLNNNEKLNIVAALRKVKREKLDQALIAAALPPNLCKLPEPLQQEMIHLQTAYQQYRNFPKVAEGLLLPLREAMIAHGCPLFHEMLAKPFDESQWNSDFLYTLAKELNIKIEMTPTVQATIQNGKVYWRIIRGQEILHNRPEIKGWNVKFTDENSWFMSWEMFRTFKDSGKRYSPLTITKHDFTHQFLPAARDVAAAIWEELCQLNIIDRNTNKLSRGWCVLQGANIQLQSIENLKAKTSKATKDFKKQYYAHTIATIYKLVNDKSRAEQLECIPGASIFRPERTRKLWEGTGRIINDQPTAEFSSTKLWDVSPYVDLEAHRNTTFEKNTYKVKLNYDHIPAASTLENGNTPPALEIKEFKQALQYQIRVMEKQGYPIKHETRKTMQNITPEQQVLEEQANGLINQLAAVSKAFHQETHQLGYTVAMPEKLHHSGDTFAQSATDQQLREGHLFLDDIEAHIKNIKKDPAAFSLKMDDLIKALGAFRTLYRRACKPVPAALPRQLPIGRIAPSFFAEPADKERADKMFTAEMQEFLSQRESKPAMLAALRK